MPNDPMYTAAFSALARIVGVWAAVHVLMLFVTAVGIQVGAGLL